MREASLLWDRRELAGTENEEKKRAHRCGADTRMKIKDVGRGNQNVSFIIYYRIVRKCDLASLI